MDANERRHDAALVHFHTAVLAFLLLPALILGGSRAEAVLDTRLRAAIFGDAEIRFQRAQ
jgi:hypothetical protein